MKTSNFPADTNYSGIYLFDESEVTLPVDLDMAKNITALIEEAESCRFQLVEIVFVDEDEIMRINREHLERNYITDIISFRYDTNTSDQSIEGTLYCCAPRIYEQADEFGQTPEVEFKRVIIHGLLHLAGYEDKSKADRERMRNREDFFIKKLV